MRILVVDDNTGITALVKRSLEPLGYSVDAYNSSEEALETFRRNFDDFEVVLLAPTMPDLSGTALAQEIQHIKPGTPIVLMTGYGEPLGADRLGVTGVRAVIGTPFTGLDLAATIEKALVEGSMANLAPEVLSLLSEREGEVARAFFLGRDRDKSIKLSLV